MCGIAGIFDQAGRSVDPQVISGMLEIIRHRGPDYSGIQCDRNVGLGSVRLSIFDLSPAGHMPMEDPETGNWIIHNGEIYNFKELVNELGLTNLKSGTDTEVILKAYAKLGEKCLDHFNGIFAFCIWDAAKRRLFCARDQLGVKPFLYRFENGLFQFASEIKALLAAGVDRRPNLGVIHDYLARGLYDHQNETFFDGIEQLPPGHFLIIDQDRFETVQYWDLKAVEPANASRSFDDYGEEFRSRLERTIRLQLQSDTPVALHVSGGLDSTLLMAMIDKLNNGQNDLFALTQIYGEEGYDETPYVEAVSRELGWNVETRLLKVSNVPDLAREAMWQQEQPFPGMVTLAKQHLMKSSGELGAKVVLEGQGGDEIGAGYQYYFGPFIMDLVAAGDIETAIREINGFGALNGLNGDQLLRKILNGMASYETLGRSADGSSFVHLNVLNPDILHRRKNSFVEKRPFDSKLLNMQYRDIFSTKLPRILRSCDRASMGYGRELRVPLLDKDLVEFSFSLPPQVKINGGAQRSFMRQVLRDLIPPTIYDRQKAAVVDPQRDWLKGPLSGWVWDIIRSDRFAARGLFDPDQVESAFQSYLSQPAPENSFHIWQWVSMELWYQEYIDHNPRI